MSEDYLESLEDAGVRLGQEAKERWERIQDNLKAEGNDFLQLFASVLVDLQVLELGNFKIDPKEGFGGERKITCPQFTITIRCFDSVYTKNYFNGTNLMMLQFKKDPRDRFRIITLPSQMNLMFDPLVYETYAQWLKLQIIWYKKNAVED